MAVFDVTAYGAVGNGTTDDGGAVRSAIAAAITAGGGVVWFPKGTYLFGTPDPVQTWLCCVVNGNYVYLKGEGPGLSILTQASGINAAIVDFEGVVGGGVYDLEIDGNRANNTGGHGIRGGGDLTNWTVSNVFIHDTPTYGIGLQYDAPSTATYNRVTLRDIILEDIGDDGIDIKNSHHDNIACRMHNIIVRRPGLKEGSANAGIDVRGPWQMSDIYVEDFGQSVSSGIRLHAGETSDSSGLGAHNSTLTNFSVRGGDEMDSATIGLDMCANNCQVSGGYVVNCGSGVRVSQRDNNISSVTARDCNVGFDMVAAGNPTQGDNTTISACSARGCADSGFRIYTNRCMLSSINAYSNTIRGVNIRSGATKNTVAGVSISNGTNLYNVGTSSNVTGLLTS